MVVFIYYWVIIIITGAFVSGQSLNRAYISSLNSSLNWTYKWHLGIDMLNWNKSVDFK